MVPQVLDDLRNLAKVDEALVDAAFVAIQDVARHSKVGKELGRRNVSGDLAGCRRVRFDVAGRKPQRYRLIYRVIGSDTIEVIAIGPRGGHAVYMAAVERLGFD